MLYVFANFHEWYIIESAFLLGIGLVLFGYAIGFSEYKIVVQHGGRRHGTGLKRW